MVSTPSAEQHPVPDAERIIECRYYNQHQLFEGLRQVRLRGLGQPRIYERANLNLVTLDPEEIVPAQQYVLRPQVARIRRIYDQIWEGRKEILLDGYLKLRFAGSEEWVPFLPPIVEVSREDGSCLLLNDGMHRVYAARQSGRLIRCVLASRVSYPYYAYPLPGGWEAVREVDTPPEHDERKAYRNPEDYKALFRDFNAVFPGVQAQRVAISDSPAGKEEKVLATKK